MMCQRNHTKLNRIERTLSRMLLTYTILLKARAQGEKKSYSEDSTQQMKKKNDLTKERVELKELSCEYICMRTIYYSSMNVVQKEKKSSTNKARQREKKEEENQKN